MARQKLGQHFLVNTGILERIAAAACPAREHLVIEIGPGRGALTEHLLQRADRVVAIELDRELAESLHLRFPTLEIIQGDVLKQDLTLWAGAPIAGNLPYYITSPIIEKTMRARPSRAVFLIQKEVAERLTAKPGTRDYGYLTVLAAAFANARLLFTVKPGSFRPPPKVDSAVVLLEPHEPVVADIDAFLSFAGHCFRQKRKTIRNNLEPHYGPQVSDFPEAGKRAEQLSVQQLVELYRRVTPAP